MIDGHHLRIAVIPDFVAVVMVELLAGQIAVIEGRMSATRNDHIVAQLKCHLDRRIDAEIRLHTRNDQFVDTLLLQILM